MQGARVIWECINQATNDVICIINIDEMVNRTLLNGRFAVGYNMTALQSGQGHPYRGTLIDRLRSRRYEDRVAAAPEPFENYTGVFWLYRPYLLDVIQEDKYSTIRNGFDDFIFDRIKKSRYNIVYTHRFTHALLDRDNGLIDWMQFHRGVWYYAHNSFAHGRKSWFPGWGRVTLWGTRKAQFHVIRGYLWAYIHKDSEQVRLATQLTLQEWLYRGKMI